MKPAHEPAGEMTLMLSWQIWQNAATVEHLGGEELEQMIGEALMHVLT